MTNRLPELVDFYLKWHHIEGHTQATVKDYRANLGLFLRWLEGQDHSLDIGDLSPFHVLGYLEYKKRQGNRPRYIRSIYQHVNTFLNWCVEWGIIDPSPSAKIKPPKVPKVRKPFLKPDDFRALLNLCDPPVNMIRARRLAMLWLFATTGLRRMELAALLIEDLDWDRQLVVVKMGKGQKDRRVPLHREAQKALLKYLAHRRDRLPELWLTEEGRPLTYWGVGQDMKRLAERAGLDGQARDVCHIHRRTWAGNAVRQGIPRPYIQAIGGWESPDMIDLYTAAMMDEEEAIEAFKDFEPFGPG